MVVKLPLVVEIGPTNAPAVIVPAVVIPAALILPTFKLANPTVFKVVIALPLVVVAIASKAWSFSTQTHAVFTAPYELNAA